MTNLPARLRAEAQLVHGKRRDLLIEAAEALERGVIVPSEPTERMKIAGWEAWKACPPDMDIRKAVVRAMRAMIKEAQS